MQAMFVDGSTVLAMILANCLVKFAGIKKPSSSMLVFTRTKVWIWLGGSPRKVMAQYHTPKSQAASVKVHMEENLPFALWPLGMDLARP